MVGYEQGFVAKRLSEMPHTIASQESGQKYLAYCMKLNVLAKDAIEANSPYEATSAEILGRSLMAYDVVSNPSNQQRFLDALSFVLSSRVPQIGSHDSTQGGD